MYVKVYEMKRTQLRETIFKIIFRVEFNQQPEMPEQVAFQMEQMKSEAGIKPDKRDEAYIEQKSLAIIEQIQTIDETIEQSADHWHINRIGKVELAILRVAVYEILFDEDVPDKVAINEAIELAKRYGTEEAPAFINGVLAKVSK